jgi:hypothetical protein
MRIVIAGNEFPPVENDNHECGKLSCALEKPSSLTFRLAHDSRHRASHHKIHDISIHENLSSQFRLNSSCCRLEKRSELSILTDAQTGNQLN